MKMCQILTYTLVVGFAFNICSCGFGRNETTPSVKEEYTFIFENKEITTVVPYKAGCIVVLDSAEIEAIDAEGTVVASKVFDKEITHISADQDGTVIMSFEDNEVVSLSLDENEFSEILSVYAEGELKDVSCAPSEDLYFILLDNGELYGFGKNSHRILDSDKNEDEIISDLVFIQDSIKYIAGGYLVDTENCVHDLISGTTNPAPFSEDVNGIELYSSPVIYTDDTLYVLSGISLTPMQEQSIDSASFVCAELGYLYSLNGVHYYTGVLSATPRGKGISETNNSVVELPSDMSYCVILHGIVCYDEHHLITYSV